MYTAYSTAQVPVLLDDPYYDSPLSSETNKLDTYLQMSLYIMVTICLLYFIFYVRTGAK